MQFFTATTLRYFLSSLFFLLFSCTLLLAQSFSHNWDTRFDLPGVNGTINATALDEDDNLYVLGDFTAAHGAPSTASLTMWNGIEWSSLGLTNGVVTIDGTEFSLLPDGPLLSVGQHVYLTAELKDRAPTTYSSVQIVVWNGVSWARLGGLFDGAITHLTSNGTNVYAAGNFRAVGAKHVSNLARWNGSEWQDINWRNQLFGGGTITALSMDNMNNLLVAGINGSGKWNGNTWQAVGNSPISKNITSFASAGSVLYALATSVRSHQLYRLDGSTWTHISQSYELQYDIVSPQLVVDEIGSLYLLTQKRGSGSATAGLLTQLNGTTWTTFPAQFTEITSLVLGKHGTFFLAGSFPLADDTLLVNGITHWNGTNWEPLQAEGTSAQGLIGNVADVEFANGYLYVGGTAMASINLDGTHGILRKHNQSNWEIVGGGLDGSVHSIEKNPVGGIYVGGCFTKADNTLAANVAWWNGTRWSALGTGPGFCVKDLAVTANALYAVGETSLAKWDGQTWTTLATDIQGTPLAVAANEDGTVYVGGQFTFVGNQQVNNIAQWANGGWTPLETGVHLHSSSHAHPGAEFAEIRDLAIDGNLLYAGGRFDEAGTTEAYNIARWNGRAWESLYDGLTGITPSILLWWELPPIVEDIHITTDLIYAAGHFRVAGKSWEDLGPYSIGSGITFMEKSTGVWEPLLPGVSTIFGQAPTVNAASAVGDTIYLGGDFRTAGNYSSYRVARTLIPPATVHTPLASNALDFGLTTVDYSSDSVLLLTNPSTSTRTLVGSVEIVDGPFELTGRTDIRVSPGQTVRIPVRFSPTVLGPVQGLARIRHNATAGSQEIIIPLSGTGIAPLAVFDYSPKSIDFGKILQQPSTRTRVVQITNSSSSTKTLTIRAKALSVPFSYIRPNALETIALEPGQTHSYEIEALLNNVGDFNSELIIQHDGDLNGTITVPLHLTVTARIARLLVTPLPLDFGDVRVGDRKTLDLSIQSDPASNQSQSYGLDIIEEPFRRFTASTTVLIPGETSSASIEFRPRDVGAVQTIATLFQIVGTDTTRIEVPIKGRGIPGTIAAEISPLELDFGNVQFPQSKELSVTVSNLATSTLSLSIEDQSGIAVPFTFRRRIRNPILPNSTDKLTIQFTPFSEDEEFTDTLLIAHNSPSLPNPVQVVLHGSSITTSVNEHAHNNKNKASLQLQVEPNPLSKNGAIRFRIPKAADVVLEVFTLDGRNISHLAKGRYTAGEHRVEWNTNGLASGTYLCRLTAGNKETSITVQVE